MPTASTEQNKALARQLIEIFNQRDVAALGQVLPTDYVHHDPALPLPTSGLEGYRQATQVFFDAFRDAHMTIEDLTGEEDRVAFRWTFRGTHTGPLMGIPPTGKQVSISAIQLSRVAGGKIVESWVNYDAMGLLQQLGAIPAPAGA
ncbi:MAG: ester cyclase [Chloroflexi bacterium]|nr:ester cyclase [Chloroflexota bacterium]